MFNKSYLTMAQKLPEIKAQAVSLDDTAKKLVDDLFASDSDSYFFKSLLYSDINASRPKDLYSMIHDLNILQKCFYAIAEKMSMEISSIPFSVKFLAAYRYLCDSYNPGYANIFAELVTKQNVNSLFIYYYNHLEQLKSTPIGLEFMTKVDVQNTFDFTYKNEVAILLKNEINLNQTAGVMGNTPLLSLISNSYNKAALSLIRMARQLNHANFSCDIVSQKFGTSALHLAVAKGYRYLNVDRRKLEISNIEVTQELLKSGANIDLQTTSEQGGQTALHLACVKRDIAFIELLLQHQANIHIKNDKGQTPLEMLDISYFDAKTIIDKATGGMYLFDEYYEKDVEIIKQRVGSYLVTHYENRAHSINFGAM